MLSRCCTFIAMIPYTGKDRAQVSSAAISKPADNTAKKTAAKKAASKGGKK